MAIDTKELAIADCLRHPKFGILSHQPDIFAHPFPSGFVAVRDIDFHLFAVKASECEWASDKEKDEYWSINKPKK